MLNEKLRIKSLVDENYPNFCRFNKTSSSEQQRVFNFRGCILVTRGRGNLSLRLYLVLVLQPSKNTFVLVGILKII